MSNYYIIDNLFGNVKRSVNFMRKRLGGYANDVPFNPLEAVRRRFRRLFLLELKMLTEKICSVMMVKLQGYPLNI